MSGSALKNIDLNLLVVLEVLVRKQSVVATARELGCGQPSVSKKLAALRELVGDPLLVRKGRKMVLTPRAEKIAESLPQRLFDLQECVARASPFDPTTSTGCVRIGLQYYPVELVSDMVRTIGEQAPGLDLHLLDLRPDEAQDQLTAGRVELLVHIADARGVFGVQEKALQGYGRYAENLHMQQLYDQAFVTIAHEDHEGIDGGLDLDTFTRIPHVLFSAEGDAFGFVDRSLAEIGRSRRVGALVQSWIAGCEIVARSGYLMTLNHDMALYFAKRHPLSLYRTPIEMPRSHLSSLWHVRHHDDPRHRWIRKRTHEIGKRICDRLRDSELR